MRLIDADALIAETMKNRCADCDRRKGIKQGKTTFVYDFGEAPCRACDVGDMIDTLDEATTISGWISVKDGLPEEHADEHPYEFEQYLCVTVWDYVRTMGFGTRIGDDKPHFWSGNSIWDDWVTHWMPLPEPPEKEK